MPSTVEAVILPGWMERDFAIEYLMKHCVFDPPIDAQRAAEIWQCYRDRVEALPERDVSAPERLSLNDEEKRAADTFLRHHQQQSGGHGSIRDVIKIDPSRLIAHQFYVVLDRAREYMQHATARTWSARNCLATVQAPRQITIHSTLNAMDVEIPHGEFAFAYHPQGGQYGILELARHVSVTEFQGRMLLWAGYHRSYARIARANPDGIDRSMLVAVTTDADFFVSEQSPNQGLRVMVCGARPPLFADFFDERFFMALRLRKKRFQLQIRARVVALDV